MVPIVLYGCDTWYLLADMEKQFRLSKTSAWEGSSETRTQHKYQGFGTKHDCHIGRTPGTSTGNSQYTGLPGHVTRLDTVLKDTLEGDGHGTHAYISLQSEPRHLLRVQAIFALSQIHYTNIRCRVKILKLKNKPNKESLLY